MRQGEGGLTRVHLDEGSRGRDGQPRRPHEKLAIWVHPRSSRDGDHDRRRENATVRHRSHAVRRDRSRGGSDRPCSRIRTSPSRSRDTRRAAANRGRDARSHCTRPRTGRRAKRRVDPSRIWEFFGFAREPAVKAPNGTARALAIAAAIVVLAFPRRPPPEPPGEPGRRRSPCRAAEHSWQGRGVPESARRLRAGAGHEVRRPRRPLSDGDRNDSSLRAARRRRARGTARRRWSDGEYWIVTQGGATPLGERAQGFRSLAGLVLAGPRGTPRPIAPLPSRRRPWRRSSSARGAWRTSTPRPRSPSGCRRDEAASCARGSRFQPGRERQRHAGSGARGVAPWSRPRTGTVSVTPDRRPCGDGIAAGLGGGVERFAWRPGSRLRRAARGARQREPGGSRARRRSPASSSRAWAPAAHRSSTIAGSGGAGLDTARRWAPPGADNRPSRRSRSAAGRGHVAGRYPSRATRR